MYDTRLSTDAASLRIGLSGAAIAEASTEVYSMLPCEQPSRTL